jgi:hypothetical protein
MHLVCIQEPNFGGGPHRGLPRDRRPRSPAMAAMTPEPGIRRRGILGLNDVAADWEGSMGGDAASLAAEIAAYVSAAGRALWRCGDGLGGRRGGLLMLAGFGQFPSHHRQHSRLPVGTARRSR